MASIIIISLIFIYTIYVLIKFFKKSKSGGMCAHCELSKSCASDGCIPNTIKFLEKQDAEAVNTTEDIRNKF